MGRRIALFGGSFDPPHLGHVLCAAYAWAVGGLDALWVLPVDRHPYGKDLEPWAVRWPLCRAAFAGLGFVEVRDDERANPGGRTITLLERYRERYPGERWILLGGTDTEDDVRNWYRGEDLLALVEVLTIPRRGYDDDHPAALPAISSTLVRQRIAAGRAVDDLVPHAVAALIAEHGWYGWSRPR